MLIVAACFAGVALLCAGVLLLIFWSTSGGGPTGMLPPGLTATAYITMWGAGIFGALAVLSFLFWLLPMLASMAGG